MYLDYRATEPVLVVHPKRLARSLPAGIGYSQGPLPLAPSVPAMHLPGAVRVLASSMLRAPTLRERPPQHVGLTEARREPITVFMANGNEIIIKKV
jgi:hypothetical protein